MYKTKIKDKFFAGNSQQWWGGLEKGKEYSVIMTVEDMSIMCDLESGIMVDVFNNKLDDFQIVTGVTVIVEAKNLEYQERFGLNGKYKIKQGDRKNGNTRLHLSPVDGIGEDKIMFPSRLRVVELDLE